MASGKLISISELDFRRLWPHLAQNEPDGRVQLPRECTCRDQRLAKILGHFGSVPLTLYPDHLMLKLPYQEFVSCRQKTEGKCTQGTDISWLPWLLEDQPWRRARAMP